MKNLTIVVFILVVSSCKNFDPTRAGSKGYSRSIEESKEREAYVCEYNYIIEPDSIKYLCGGNFKEIFLEKVWNYGLYRNWTEFWAENEDEYRIVIVVDNVTHYIDSKIRYWKDKQIALFGENILSKGGEKFGKNYVITGGANSIQDTIVYEMGLGFDYDSLVHIGKLILVKK